MSIDASKVITTIIDNTSNSITQIQKKYIPALSIQNIASVLDFYTYNNRTVACENCCAIRLTTDIQAKDINYYSYYDSTSQKQVTHHHNACFNTAYTDLVNNGYFRKIMLFINDKLVKWSTLSVISDHHYKYLIVNGIYKTSVSSVKLIYVPNDVQYSESGTMTSRSIGFDSNGLLSDTGTTVYTFIDTSLKIEKFTTTAISTTEQDIRLTTDAFITFKDGIIYPTTITETGYNEFTVPSGVISYIFYYSIVYTPVEHISKMSNKTLAKQLYSSAESTSPLKKIYDKLTLNGIDSVSTNIRKIAEYDRTLLNGLFEVDDVFSFEESASYLKNSAVNGYARVGCPVTTSDYGMMMFVDGELYSDFYNCARDGWEYKIPVGSLTGNETVEFLYFSGVNNLVYYITPTSSVLDISISDDTMLFCKGDVDNFWLKINYTVVSGKVYVDSSYIGKQLAAFNNKCFYHYGVKLTEKNVAGITLPVEFSMCKDWGRYMVFLNGRKLDQNCYCITTMKKSTDPFAETSVFPAIPLSKNDTLDVFYLPKLFEDLTEDVSIGSDGYITIPMNQLAYGLSNKTCLIFMNGKKVNYSYLKDTNFYKIKLNVDIKTLDNMTIVQIVFDSSSYGLKGLGSDWDIITSSLHPNDIDSLLNLNTARYKATEETIYANRVNIETPLYEVFYKYYLANFTGRGDGEYQIYDFIAADYPIDGNYMYPGVFNAELEDKLAPE